MTLRESLRAMASQSQSRESFWVEFVNWFRIEEAAEIGVYRGDFARLLLECCESLTRYYMIDPWKHLVDWNKPANHDDAQLEAYYQETRVKTEFAAGKTRILRGKTVDVMDQIPDYSLDFAYVDGDHTLKGITVDLMCMYPKMRVGGFLTGDDFTPSIWEHKTSFEPTLVFPLAVYFAEAVGATIFALPHSQFCMQKSSQRNFSFEDLTGTYRDTSLRDQISPEKVLRLAAWERFPNVMNMLRKTKSLLSQR